MQPEKARAKAHEVADKSKAEREQKNIERESRKIGDTIQARTDELFAWGDPLEKSSGAIKYHSRTVRMLDSRHGFIRFLTPKRLFNVQRTKLPVQLGESTTPEGENLSRFGLMQRESSSDINRVRFLVAEKDNDDNRIGLEQELAVLEHGVLTVSEKRKRDEVVVSSENDETLILVNEMLDKFEKQAQEPRVPAGL